MESGDPSLWTKGIAIALLIAQFRLKMRRIEEPFDDDT
jgi:hypothetical protein